MPDDKNESTDALPEASRVGEARLEAEEARAFAAALDALNEAGVPHLIAGAFAIHAYTGLWRDTKDLDLFLKPEDLGAALAALEEAGFETEIEFRHWLAKGRREPYFIDIIFGTGNGQLQVDQSWLARSRPVEIAGVESRLIAPEELLVSKVYVAERYRFDGADVLHLILKTEGQLDWGRVRTQLGDNWDLLLWHLVLFAFVYPGHLDYLPPSLLPELFAQAQEHWRDLGKRAPVGRKTFRGALLDPFTFAADLDDWGYEDRRVTEPLVDEEGKDL